MRLFDTVLSIVFVAMFSELFIGATKPVLNNLNENKKTESRYNCDKFIAESFLACCEKSGENETLTNAKANFDEWKKEISALCPIENLKIERLYENNPSYVKAVWIQDGVQKECIGKILSEKART